MPLSDSQRSELEKLVKSGDVVLFMKGNRQFPACGFSATVVGILGEVGAEFSTVNILSDPGVREGMKEFSGWPTFPQLYVKGTFVGGCDIVKEMHASGELQKLLGTESKPVAPPTVKISEKAAAAFRDAAPEEAGDVLRMVVEPDFTCDLHFGPKEAGDLEVEAGGLKLYVPRSCAARAHGVSIDFVEGPQGAAFRIDNPNEPPRVRRIGPRELQEMLDAGKVELFDVRPEAERAVASIAKARSLDGEGQRYLFDLPKDTPIALHCHHGMRSRSAAEQLLREGFTRVYNLEGGIEAWSREVDPSVPRY
jgi:monothiol glutaredoxin